MNGRNHQGGVVLLSVLLILSLLVALSYQLVGRQSLVVAQARQTFAGDQAMSYALGGEAFARQLLYEDFSETGAVDDLTERWAVPLEPFEIENGFMEVRIQDLNSCFNLNSLASVQGGGQGGANQNLQRFQTLLRNSGLPDSLAEVWLDWIDPDQDISGFGAEDGDYLLGDVPHRTANQLAGHPSELNMLKDMSAEYLEVLLPRVCVLPVDALKLNVNTASAAALASLSPALSEIELLTMTETERTYAELNQVTGEYPDMTPAVESGALSVNSEYFEVQVRSQVDDSLVELSTVLFRSSNDGTITVLTRDLGKHFRSLFAEDENANPLVSGS